MEHKARRVIGTHARIAELSQVLTEAAYQLGLETSIADKWKRKILRAMENKKTKKLRDWRYKSFIGRENRLTREGAAALVMTTMAKKKRVSKMLTPVEERAVEILLGAKLKPKKNFIETRAIALAGAVRREWFSYKGKKGRPKGARSRPRQTNHAIGTVAIADMLLSIEEIIIAVLQVIEEIIGNPPPSPVLVAAVRIEKPGATDASILTIAASVRKKMRPRT